MSRNGKAHTIPLELTPQRAKALAAQLQGGTILGGGNAPTFPPSIVATKQVRAAMSDLKTFLEETRLALEVASPVQREKLSGLLADLQMHDSELRQLHAKALEHATPLLVESFRDRMTNIRELVNGLEASPADTSSPAQ